MEKDCGLPSPNWGEGAFFHYQGNFPEFVIGGGTIFI